MVMRSTVDSRQVFVDQSERTMLELSSENLVWKGVKNGGLAGEMIVDLHPRSACKKPP